MKTLCIIIGRAGSKGLPGKNVMPIADRPMIAWTIDHAKAAKQVDHIVVSTDGQAIADAARAQGVEVIIRSAELASDTATVDAAVRHAVKQIEHRTSNIEHVVILYANVPIRPIDLIDRAIDKLTTTGCDSVQSVCPAGKMHPYWQKQLGGVNGDALEPFIENDVYRRQDLPAVYQLDGGLIAVTREALFTVRNDEPHAFLGNDRRAIITQPGEVVDVDEPKDAAVAEAMLASVECGMRNAEVVIGGRGIGGDQPTYVIAELGVNHDGSVERALELTRIAKQSGADAVKLQLFDPDLLLSAEAELAKYQEDAADDPHAMLRALQLDVDEMLQVKAEAHALGLGFIVTPFSMESVDDMRRLDPDAVKIASPDCVNTPLVEAMQTLGKPMIISTGASEHAELVSMLPMYRRTPCVLLDCISSYPIPREVIETTLPRDLRRLGFLMGYSDHEDAGDLRSGVMAVEIDRVCMIERHLTYDRHAAGPDHAASLDPQQMTKYIDLIREHELQFPMTESVPECERDVRRVSRQSVCAVRDLVAGHVITRDDLTVKRPGTGVPAAQLNAIIGKELKRDVKANHLLHEGDV